MKRAKFLVLLLICIAQMFSITANEALASGKKSNRKKVLFVGDSYSTRPFGKKHWTNYLRKQLKIKRKDIKKSLRGGSGFAVTNPEKNFVDRLKKLKKDSSVKYIVIVGGVGNDLLHTEQEVSDKMKEFDLIAAKKFPSARIFYAIPNYNVKDKEKNEIMLTRKAFCSSVAKSLGWKYLKKSETCLYGKKSCIGKDGHHPSKKGQKVLAKALLKDLRSYGITRKKFRSSGKNVKGKSR